VQAGREAPQQRALRLGTGVLRRRAVDVDAAAAALERRLDGLDGAHLLDALDAEAVGDDVDHLARPRRRGDLALGVTRVKPLAASHCSISSALVPPGSSTGKVTMRRGSFAAVRSSRSA
jgi:hypothetical protein